MNHISEAIKIANRSSIRTHKTGAVIVRERTGDIVSNGWSHVPNYKLKGKRSLHAEMHALARARHLDLDNFTHYCYVATIINSSGNVVGAKPCLDCAIALHAAGIEVVYYTLPRNTGTWLNLRDPSTFADLKVYESNRV